MESITIDKIIKLLNEEIEYLEEHIIDLSGDNKVRVQSWLHQTKHIKRKIQSKN